MSDMVFDDFDYNRQTCENCGYDYDDREGCDCEENKNIRVERVVIKKPNSDDELCHLCNDNEMYEKENRVVAIIIGGANCHYCGNEIKLCRKHYTLLKDQINTVYL